jgi:hypothetical protein
VRAGRFPPPVQLGDNSIGWPAREIDGWRDSQPRRTYGAPATEALQGAHQPISTTAQITAALAAPEAQQSAPTAREIATAPAVPKRVPNGKAREPRVCTVSAPSPAGQTMRRSSRKRSGRGAESAQ